MILNPWAALREARDSIKAQNERINDLHKVLDFEQTRRNTDGSEFHLRSRILLAQIERLEDLIKEGHFRNPKTGRLGRKGERFK